MARKSTPVSVPHLIESVKSVEENGGLDTLDALYGAVTRKYASQMLILDNDRFPILSPQVIKKHIETLVNEGKLQIKTEPGRRSGGVQVDSKKDLILTGLNAVVKMIESGNSADALAEIERIRVITESLHARKSKTEETSDESDEVIEPIAPESDEVPVAA